MRNLAWRVSVSMVVAGLVGACGPTKNEDTESGTSTGSTTGTTTGTTTSGTSTPTSGTSDVPTGPASEGPGSSGGSIPPCGEATGGEETCAALTDRAACNGAPLDPAVGKCTWVAWFATRLVDGTCTFGDPRGQCMFVGCSNDGCGDGSACGTLPLPGGFRVDQEGNVSVGLGDWCDVPRPPAEACWFDGEGQVIGGAPECACLCDPAFPGAQGV